MLRHAGIGFVLLFSFSESYAAENWQVHIIDNEQQGADGVRLADVNNDQLLDIASGWEEAGETRVYIHPGWEKVNEPWPKVMVGKSGKVEDAVFADLDEDGSVDVVSSSESRRIFVHWAPQDSKKYLDKESWQTQVLPSSKGVQKWMIAVPFQIDGKNGIDLLAAGKGEQVVWFESPKTPRDLSQWKMHVISNKGGWTMGLKSVDMDGDGDNDVLLGIRRGNPGVKWLENPGPGQKQKNFWQVHDVGLQGQGQGAGFVEAVDLDGDGFLDVIAPAMEKAAIMIYRGLNRNSTKWQTIEIPMPKSRNKGVAVGDIDLDGRTDVVITHEFGDVVWLSLDGEIGAGHWTYNKVYSGGKLDDIELYDVDGDGDLDMITTDEKGLQVIWIENPVVKKTGANMGMIRVQ